MTTKFYKPLILLFFAVFLQSSYSLAEGNAVFFPIGAGGTTPAGQTCPQGEFVYGFDAKGNILCSSITKTVFVTDAAYYGDLGGVTGADNKCQAAADDAGLRGVYKAWISNPTSSPATTFTRSTTPYMTTNGNQVAANWKDLTDGTLLNPINRDEYGYVGGVYVWTYTEANGTKSDLDVVKYSCNQFTVVSNYFYGVVGFSGAVDSLWTHVGSRKCDDYRKNHLYCFQQ